MPAWASGHLGESSVRLAGMAFQASSYGDSTSEYRAARDEAGLVDLSERAVLEASGPARQSFLQGMLSNEVAALRPGSGCRAALLNPKGAVQALVRVLVEETIVTLEADAARLPALQHTLERHRVAAPVRFAVRETAVIAVIGPRADAVLGAAGGTPPPAAPEAHVRTTLGGHELRIVRAGDLPRGGIALHVPKEHVSFVFERLRAAGARPTGREALDALRVEELRAWCGTDVSELNLLHETGLLTECHSPTKGCYLGQEIVARLSARGGHVNKALRGLRLTAPARAGDAVSAEAREVGRLTTAVVSPRLGPIALGYVQRSHFAAGTSVEVGGAPATVVTAFEE